MSKKSFSIFMPGQAQPTNTAQQIDRAIYDQEGEIPGDFFAGIDQPPETQIIHVPTLALDEQGNIPAGKFTLTPRGLIVTEGATFEEWLEVGGVLRRLDTSLQWLIGDWMNYGERVWGQTYQQVAALTGYTYQTLREYSYVARSVDLSIRIDKLSFAHHQIVASFEPDAQRQWLDYATAHSLSIAQMRNAVSGRPPTPSAKDDPLGYFHGSLMDFWRKAHKAIKAVGQSERQQMAAYLRQLADELDERAAD